MFGWLAVNWCSVYSCMCISVKYEISRENIPSWMIYISIMIQKFEHKKHRGDEKLKKPLDQTLAPRFLLFLFDDKISSDTFFPEYGHENSVKKFSNFHFCVNLLQMDSVYKNWWTCKENAHTHSRKNTERENEWARTRKWRERKEGKKFDSNCNLWFINIYFNMSVVVWCAFMVFVNVCVSAMKMMMAMLVAGIWLGFDCISH